jgi:DnaJ-like protein
MGIDASTSRCLPSNRWGAGLAVETDFLALYRQLGLSPGCKLADFKQAYRRHVSILHPDRNDAAAPEDHERFGRLVMQYNAAMDFHRRHGRLPGATVGPRPASVDAAPADPVAPSRLPPRRERVTHTPRPMLLLAAALVVIALIAWGVGPIDSTPDAETPAQQTASASDEPSTQAPQLAIGMSPDDVRAIEGDPTAVHGERWEYGPSWVRFERETLVDWYSSPFHSLKAASARPRGERD